MLFPIDLCVNCTHRARHMKKYMSKSDGIMINGLVTSQTRPLSSLSPVMQTQFLKTDNGM